MRSDTDIARAARELRDEQNRQLHIRPWSRRRHFRLPAWLAAIPAAVIVGFLLGFWTNSHTQGGQSATALADTVYVVVKEPSARPDSARVPGTTVQPSSGKHIRRAKGSRQAGAASMGQPVANDRIRYDLLVKN